LGNLIFISKKRSEKNAKYEYDDNIRAYDNIYQEQYKKENKTGYNANSKVLKEFKYDIHRNKSYGFRGGLYAELDVEELLKTNTTEKLYDPYDNIIVAEFLIENIELDILVKYTFISILEFGGSIKNTYNIEVIQKSMFSNIIGLIKISSIGIACIFMIWEIISFYKEIKKLNQQYSDWLLRIEIGVTDLAKKARALYMPEYRRRLYILFNIPRLLLLIILLSNIAYNVFFVLVIKEQIILYSEYNQLKIISMKKIQFLNYNEEVFYELTSQEKEQIYRIKNQFFILSKFKNYLDYFSAVFMFFGFLRIIFSFNVGFYFYAFSKIYIKTIGKNLKVVFVIILILPAFVFYSHILFGKEYFEYKYLTDSIITNFYRIFYFDKFEKDKFDAYILIYKLLYGISINLLLVNLFVSVINTSYLRITSKIFRLGQFEWSEVFCPCCKRKRKNITSNSGKESIINEINKFNQNKKIQIMFHNIDFKDIDDFCKTEFDSLQYINENLNCLKTLFKMMEINIKVKSREKSILLLNRFSEVDEETMNLQIFSSLNFKMNLMNTLEKDTLNILELTHKFKLFYLSIKDKVFLEKTNKNFKQIMIEIENKELKMVTIISDIENLRKIKNEVDKIDKYGEEEEEKDANKRKLNRKKKMKNFNNDNEDQNLDEDFNERGNEDFNDNENKNKNKNDKYNDNDNDNGNNENQLGNEDDEINFNIKDIYLN
jgi:hypothetical protein